MGESSKKGRGLVHSASIRLWGRGGEGEKTRERPLLASSVPAKESQIKQKGVKLDLWEGGGGVGRGRNKKKSQCCFSQEHKSK